MKLPQDSKRYFWLMLALFGAAALSILFFFCLFRLSELGGMARQLLNICRPFIYGAVMAYVLCPLCRRLEGLYGRKLKEKAARSLSIISTLLLSLLLLYLLLSVVVPQLARNIMGLIYLIPRRVTEAANWLMNWLEGDEVLKNYVETFSKELSDWAHNWLNSDLLPWVQNLMNGVSGGVISIVTLVVNLLVGVVVCIYLLGGRTKFASQGKLVLYSVLKPKWADRVLRELRFADKAFSGFISGKIIDSAIIGVICFLFCQLVRMPEAALVSVIVGVTNVIPFFGPYIGAIPSALLILMTSPIKCLYFVIFIIILQQIDGNILGPMILGESTGLSGIWVLFAILVFGGLFGFIGMLVGVPLFAVIYDILKKLIFAGLRRNGAEGMAEEYRVQFAPPPKPKQRRLKKKVPPAK